MAYLSPPARRLGRIAAPIGGFLIVRMVDQMARRNELVTCSCPPVPDFNLIERTLGRDIHDAVFNGKSPKQAVRDAETRLCAT